MQLIDIGVVVERILTFKAEHNTTCVSRGVKIHDVCIKKYYL